MKTCWWCYWGWPEPIVEIYQWAADKLGDDYHLMAGPAHAVWHDENWNLAAECIKDIDSGRPCGLNSRELAAVRESLVKLCRLPQEYLKEPDGYDGENPEKFPPPAHWKMTPRQGI